MRRLHSLGAALCITGCGGQTASPMDTEAYGGPPHGAISAGGGDTCAITRAGDIECWGASLAGVSAPAEGPFVDVSVDAGHVCGLRVDGTVRCWGPAELTLPGTFVHAQVGTLQACGVLEAGDIVCQPLGGPSKSVRHGSYATVAPGGFFSCGLRTSAIVECWQTRWPDHGKHVYTPEGRYVSAAGGDEHMCLLDLDGKLDCWGANELAQAEPPAGVFLHVSAGHRHSCAVALDGRIECWGDDEQGQATAPDGTFVAVGAGADHSCAVSADGAIACWGRGPGAAKPPSDGNRALGSNPHATKSRSP